MKHTLAILILVVLPMSCVMPADIEAIRANLDDYQAGAISKVEFDANNDEIQANMDARNAEMAGRGLPTDPVSLFTYAGGMLATAFGVTKHRDRNRRKRGESVSTEKPTT